MWLANHDRLPPTEEREDGRLYSSPLHTNGLATGPTETIQVSHSTVEILTALGKKGVTFREALMTYLEEHDPQLYERIIVEHIGGQPVSPL